MLAADGATPRGGGNRLFFLVMLVMLGAGLYLFWQADGKAGLDNGPAVALAAAPLSADEVETGTHWAEPPDFPTLATLGYDFVITTLHAAGVRLRHHHLASRTAHFGRRRLTPPKRPA